MAKKEGKKRRIITELFTRLKPEDERLDVINFNTPQVREICVKYAFVNQFDATKFDTYERLPQALKDEGYFIIHLGRGNHAFVSGTGYHDLEDVDEVKPWKLRGSMLDEIGASEASAFSTLYNERILHDFLCGRRDADLRIHNSRRSKFSFHFKIGKYDFYPDQLQLEIDGFVEGKDVIAPIEVKRGTRTNFEIRQLFTAMKYFEKFQREKVIPPKFSLRYIYANMVKSKKQSYARLHEYRFKNSLDFNSIEFVRAVQYNMLGASTLPL
ncbi:MAG: hypothetical protein V3V98_04960 [Thermoplasmata archaeon]